MCVVQIDTVHTWEELRNKDNWYIPLPKPSESFLYCGLRISKVAAKKFAKRLNLILTISLEYFIFLYNNNPTPPHPNWNKKVNTVNGFKIDNYWNTCTSLQHSDIVLIKLLNGTWKSIFKTSFFKSIHEYGESAPIYTIHGCY